MMGPSDGPLRGHRAARLILLGIRPNPNSLCEFLVPRFKRIEVLVPSHGRAAEVGTGSVEALASRAEMGSHFGGCWNASGRCGCVCRVVKRGGLDQAKNRRYGQTTGDNPGIE